MKSTFSQTWIIYHPNKYDQKLALETEKVHSCNTVTFPSLYHYLSSPFSNQSQSKISVKILHQFSSAQNEHLILFYFPFPLSLPNILNLAPFIPLIFLNILSFLNKWFWSLNITLKNDNLFDDHSLSSVNLSHNMQLQLHSPCCTDVIGKVKLEKDKSIIGLDCLITKY